MYKFCIYLENYLKVLAISDSIKSKLPWYRGYHCIEVSNILQAYIQ